VMRGAGAASDDTGKRGTQLKMTPLISEGEVGPQSLQNSGVTHNRCPILN
jgi:hypothetical protein